jgi:acyl-CoA dehydrogenase
MAPSADAFLGLDDVAAFLEPRHHDLARDLARWVPDRIGDLRAAETDEEARLQAREILLRLGHAGWIRFALPEAHGGVPGGADVRACCLIREALAAVSPLADAVFALQALGSAPLGIAGTDEQSARWLPLAGDGSLMTAFAMTEADAGSDVSAIATRAVRTGAEYAISGEKAFISNAGIADLYIVFASTGSRADGKNEISAFLVPADTPGVRLAESQVLSAPHPLGRMRFDDCRIPAGNRLGEEGDGFRLGMATLDRLRPTVAAAATGMAGRALAEAVGHARGRVQFGRTLAGFQLIQDKIARMATDLVAARLLVFRAAAALDGGEEGTTLRSAMAKAHATEAAQGIVDQAVQIAGGAGCLESHPLDLLYRSVRALRIYEGTTEIQRLVVARNILGAG